MLNYSQSTKGGYYGHIINYHIDCIGGSKFYMGGNIKKRLVDGDQKKFSQCNCRRHLHWSLPAIYKIVATPQKKFQKRAI